MAAAKDITGAAAGMVENVGTASNLLKALANENRLRLLCLLAKGERSVTELETTLALRQPTVSQQLARLKADDLVAHRRQGKTIYYSLVSEEARRLMMALDKLFCFCTPGAKRSKRARAPRAAAR
ncbi:MAG: metalloregulator ArsR/SmtB family transcription factor [Rhodospirillales bacterium]|nr:metalloregulator ArsR/SmtB family transcription factor [Rhodospirillales bacterium]MDH3790888.1 metalloregulator ArsR/SmtB family transcription factor [Rhodospirillales bacterium]MDH3910122.1 metalloregulator ArsR/SmtB family transcription factor [Rhodospirillales bacterium]MDH3916821.1 metalloregulator ArsR/SmtB family transcription factor [Rhodospirillales bacterium]MDH3965920.1 metalloregulator ArsR/SmtB family transcription factor [Rhodospirillales bacterium]